MGMFTKRIGGFESPHSTADTLKIVYGGVAEQLSDPEFKVTGPGLAAAVYLTRLDDSGLTVTAGNKVETYFQFLVDLTPTATGCVGEAYFDRRFGSINRWMGNALGLVSGLRSAFVQCSVRTRGWKTI